MSNVLDKSFVVITFVVSLAWLMYFVRLVVLIGCSPYITKNGVDFVETFKILL